jgi:hypothetical protein
MPFEEAASELQATLGIVVSDSTVRRLTLQAGAITEQIQTEQAQPQRSPSCFPLPKEEPAERLAMSSDGGLVPLRGGVWAEVKTLVIGEVLAPSSQETTARTTAHSYFSRLTDAATFADLASVEIERRGVERARAVCAVQDGAEWLQGFVDGHRHDAVRILDFAHAAEYLGQVAEQGKQAGYHLPAVWLPVLLHQLKHHGPSRVLAHLERLEQRWHLPASSEALRYFRKRLPQLQYPQFLAAGWPIGSGMVESANKVVMQARLKGAGMHWEPSNVNPMLALRNALRNGRWVETWQMQQQRRKQDRRAHRQLRSEQRRARLLHRPTSQMVHLCLLLPRQTSAVQPSPPKGRDSGTKALGTADFFSQRSSFTPCKNVNDTLFTRAADVLI